MLALIDSEGTGPLVGSPADLRRYRMIESGSRLKLAGAAAVAAAVTLGSGTAVADEQTLPEPKRHNVKLDGKRHGSYPAAPTVRLNGRTERVAKHERGSVGAKRSPRKGAHRARLRKPAQARISIDGWHGPYASKLAWIQYYVDNYNRRILGTRYRSPALYPNAERYSYFNCGTQRLSVVGNAVYCPANNYIAWDTSWFQGFFNYAYGGDTSVAAIYAHEWGHATQAMLSLRGWKLNYSLYRELYADCMAGSWAADMYVRGRLDNIGVGDYQEALNVLAWIASPNTPDRTHGTVSERQSFFRYGWSHGAQACVNWVVS
jgi:hypothetical protein